MATAETGYLDRLLETVTTGLNPDAARAIANFRADEKLQARIDELADKCTEGQLSDEESAEYDAYIRGIDVITILQSKARSYLAKCES